MEKPEAKEAAAKSQIPTPVETSAPVVEKQTPEQIQKENQLDAKWNKETEEKFCANGACQWKAGEETKADMPQPTPEDKIEAAAATK